MVTAMEITLFYDRELGSEERQLPAETYNATRLLLGHNNMEPVFVPIRSMQYLAIIDRKEIIFVDGNYRNRVAIAWTDFHPRQRSGLAEPVSYTARYYQPEAGLTMRRLHSELLPALSALSSKRPPPQPAKLIRLFDRG
jgi:hypothetical protein